MNIKELFKKFFYRPKSISSRRLVIRWNQTERDGVIGIRRGVKDLSLGDRNYAQARIIFENKFYIKGFCVYLNDDEFSDVDCDIIYFSTFPADTPLKRVFKPLYKKPNGKIDWNNPFGTTQNFTACKGSAIYMGESYKDFNWKNTAQFLAKKPLEEICND